jgi:hypothetical protein
MTKRMLPSFLIAALTIGFAAIWTAGCEEDPKDDTQVADTDTDTDADTDTDTDADADADTDADTDTTLLGWGCVCTENEECESGICHEFGSDGPHCTTECDEDEDCPPQLDGSDPKCNNEGRCKTGPGDCE